MTTGSKPAYDITPDSILHKSWYPLVYSLINSVLYVTLNSYNNNGNSNRLHTELNFN